MKEALEERFSISVSGNLLIKLDSHLPISGSIKARGGVYEVLKFAEEIALEKGLLHLEDDYGVLPYPKRDTTQKKYLTGTVDHYSVLSIPYTNFDLERTGVAIEALSAYNNLNVNDKYYEAIVTHKNTRDEDSVRMIDMIMDGRVYDLTTYHYKDLVVNKHHGDGALGLFFRYLVKNETHDISAYWDSCQNFLPDDLQRLIEDYMSIAVGFAS